MKRLKRLPATLLELLVVMAILAVIAGAVALSINKALISQKFETEVSMVLDELRLAQDIMIILGQDVTVVFEEHKDKDKITTRIEMDAYFPRNIQNEVQRKGRTLKTIHGVFFLDELSKDTVKGKMEIKFIARGSVMSKGILHLSTADKESAAKNGLNAYICLAGYPRPFSSVKTMEDAEKECGKKDKEFELLLQQDTLMRLPEKLKQLKQEPERPAAVEAPEAINRSTNKKEGKPKGPK